MSQTWQEDLSIHQHKIFLLISKYLEWRWFGRHSETSFLFGAVSIKDDEEKCKIEERTYVCFVCGWLGTPTEYYQKDDR